MKQNYFSIQALRALGALLVVVFHTLFQVHDQLGMEVPMFGAGAAGVDLFFAISGFIMVVVTHDIWGKAGQTWSFLKRRLIRVVPLYWLMTTVKLAVLLVGGKAVVTLWHTLASYLFIPAWASTHEAFPLLIPGWTLSFEMFFYCLFAGVLFLRKQPVWPLTVVFFALAAYGRYAAPFEFAPFTLMDQRLLEFVFGMWIGKLVLAGHRLSPAFAWPLLLCCVGAILMTNALPLVARENFCLIIWGVPAALLMFAAVSLDGHAVWKLPVLHGLGDASYAIYLTHGFAISAVCLVFERARLTGTVAEIAVVVLCVLVSCVGGYVVHRVLEKPMLEWLRKRV